MKIGVVTISDYTNYGNRLQNYAVCRVLRTRFGCEAVSLEAGVEKAFYDGHYLGWLKDQIAAKCCMFPTLAEKKWGNNITRWANFQSWSRKHIPTEHFYAASALPETLNDRYDMFFAGSDQIWNYRFPGTKYDDFFLQFARADKRAAFSASFGVETIPNEWKQVYRDRLRGFAHLSVREDAGAAIIKDLIGRDVPVLVDPVMLLSREEWLRVSKKPRADISKPYILKYYLGDEAEEERIDRWAKENGYEVYELLNDKLPQLYSAGPGEFISLIANASLVASDSFHCIAFSIIFRKPFVVYARRGAGDYMTSRMDTLLDKFGFRHRWKHLLTEKEYLCCDYAGVDEKLAAEQEKALRYLSDILTEKKNPVPSLASSEDCTGCTACAAACHRDCITMVADGNGFLHPQIAPVECVRCGRCESACPVLHPLKPSAQLHAYAAYTKDEALRRCSSSGGVFSELAKAVLAQGGAVFGAAYDAQFDVAHICAESEEELARLRGAKYAQSDLRGIFGQVERKLDAGQRVLFSGTPCQVAGLKCFLRKDYDGLVTVDFVCHSVPSPLAWREYVKYRAQQDNDGKLPTSINLRSKKTGWSRYQYSNLFEYAERPDHLVKSGESLYMKLFVDGCISRDSCTSCRSKGDRGCSDLTLGDFWGIWDVAPEMDDDGGTSVVLTRSKVGAALFEQIKARCVVREVSLEEASAQNPAMLTCSLRNAQRDAALRLVREHKIAQCEALRGAAQDSRFAARLFARLAARLHK